MSLANYFFEDSENQRKFRLVTEEQACPDCKGSGTCSACGGTGSNTHDCDCRFCTIAGEIDCRECKDGSGKCLTCGGKGVALLKDWRLRQAGLTQDEIRRIREEVRMAYVTAAGGGES